MTALLDKAQIMTELTQLSATAAFDVTVFAEIGSTNTALVRAFSELTSQPSQPSVYVAEMQSHGRGRLNRQWYSPETANIYCSLGYFTTHSLAQLSGLSLVIALGVRRCLTALFPTLNFTVKWPNDIYCQDKKLAGILLETTHGCADLAAQLAVVIGIGLNVNMTTAELDRAWTSLQLLLNKSIDRNWLLANLLIQVDQVVQQFLQTGLIAFQAEWQASDRLVGKPVTVMTQATLVTGIAQGITACGELIIQERDGKQVTVAAGEISV